MFAIILRLSLSIIAKQGVKGALKGALVSPFRKTITSINNLRKMEFSKKWIKEITKKRIKNQSINLIPREIRLIYKFYKSQDKLDFLIKRIDYIGKLYSVSTSQYNKMKKEIQKQDWEALNENLKEMWKRWNQKRRDELNELIRQARQEEKDNEKYAKIADKMAKELAIEQMKIDRINQRLGQVIIKRALDKDFKSYKDFYSQLDMQEQRRLLNILEKNNEMYIVFDSTWIEFATFIPYYKVNKDFNDRNWNVREMTTGNTRGVMTIQVKKKTKLGFTIKRVYSWVNISYSTWLRIIQDPTGTNFWKEYYKVNRKNVKHITPKSKYYGKKRI